MEAKYGEDAAALPIPEHVVFGKVVEGLRNHLNLTQTELAGAAGISNAALSRLERGESNPTLGTILALARGLGLPAHQLLKAFELAMVGATESLEAYISDDLSKAAVAAGLADMKNLNRAVGRAAASSGMFSGASSALISLGVGSAIGSGVFGALASFMRALEKDDTVRR